MWVESGHRMTYDPFRHILIQHMSLGALGLLGTLELSIWVERGHRMTYDPF